MCVPGLGVYLMREAIRGNQRQSEAIRGNQRQSEVPGLGVYVVGSVYSSAGIVAIERQYNVPKVT